ncbi:MAG: asparagine synthase (glutamine-hydrolyzing) [Saprospiraceae bacterium]
MCGIAGIISYDYQTQQDVSIQQLTNQMRHRGPDAQGIFTEGIAALGHRRLSIIDLSENANQPFFDASGRYVLVFNGEMYNFREIRQQLPDYPFHTHSDTEVIVAAYANWGAACLSRFNGMFALAIWDRVEQTLFFARDRLGVKPFYYYWNGETFAFASEIRSLLAGGFIPKQINSQGLQDYLRYQALIAPQTIVQDIWQLRPGHYGYLQNKQLTFHPYWSITRPQQFSVPASAKEAQQRVHDLFFAAVGRRMVADVPLGAFLSGGIDSSGVVAAMAAHSAEPIHTFSVTFKEQDFDESSYAELVAKKFNTRHSTLLLSPSVLLEKFPKIISAFDSPSADGINTYLISEAVKQNGITVALSGIGGDELFAGYTPFKHWYYIYKMPSWALRSASMLKVFFSGNSHRSTAKQKWLLTNLDGSIPDIYPIFRALFLPEQVRQLLKNREVLQDSHKAYLKSELNQIEQFPLLSQYSIAELTGYTANVLLRDTDQMSMAHALEVREPFFDYELLEYVLQIPDAYKFPKYPKSLFVEALGSLLPTEIVHRPKKGFSFPWNEWMKKELRGFFEARLRGLETRGIFDAATLVKMREDFFSNKGTVIPAQIMALAVLEEWLRNNEF